MWSLFKRKGLMTPRQLAAKVERKGWKQWYYEPIAEGRFSPENIEVTLTEPGASMKRSTASEAFIESKWQELIKTGFKPWPNDTRPSRFRFVKAENVGGKLKITLDPGVSYRDSIGARSHDFEKKFGPEYMPNPVAVTTIIRAKNAEGEDVLLISLRGKDVDIKPGGYHFSMGGAMDLKKDKSPTDTAGREVFEETRIKEDELKELVCRGVYKHGIGAATEVIYEASTDVLAEDIIERVRKEGDKENTRFIAIPATARDVRRWALDVTFANVGVALAGMVFIGKDIIRREEGEEAAIKWEKEMEQWLAVRSEQERRGNREALEKYHVERVKGKTS